MASTPQPNQPAESGHHPQPFSDQTNNQAARSDPPAAMAYAANGQQGYPHPYPGGGAAYPPNGTYAYGNPYYTQSYYSQYDDPGGCVRCFFFLMFLLMIFAFISTISVVFFAKPEDPVFTVESFSVTNFNLIPATKVFSGKWDTTIRMENPSYKMGLLLESLESSLYHKDNYLTAMSSWNSYDMYPRDHSTMQMKIETTNMTATGAVEDMEKEQKEGTVTFNMRLNVRYTMRSGLWYHKIGSLKVNCTDLKVAISQGSLGGSLLGGSKKCDISKD